MSMIYDPDTPDYGPGAHVEVWSDDGRTMLHEVERDHDGEAWYPVAVDGVEWQDVPADTRAVVTEYIAAVERAWEHRTRGRFC